jgi:pyruvate dehydrogenase E1 component alpha subunit
VTPEKDPMTQVKAGTKLDPARTEFYRELLHQMLRIRRLEERAAEAYALGQIGGFCHLYIGQEAVAVGSITPLRDDDYVITSYRDHGHAIVRGISAQGIMAELYGKATGCSGGKGGSMHLFDAATNFLGGHAIVGGQIPIAAGVGFAVAYRGGDQVCVCYFGDAAANIGSFHESLNIASLWKLPTIFICENNRYGMGTALGRASTTEDIATRACAYDIAAATVDGMDVIAVHDAMSEAITRARNEKKPTLLDIQTYRFVGHSMSDPVHGVYRTQEEVEEEKEQDPISRFCRRLEQDGIMGVKDFEALDDEIKKEMDDAVAFAENSPDPEPEALYTNVYAD